MLLNSFYTFQQKRIINATTWHTVIVLNPEHPLYQGHFPGQPIVPGVCMLQLIKECAEDMHQQHLQYAEIASCKFLSAINPIETNLLELTISLQEKENGLMLLLAQGKAGTNCFIKLKAKMSLSQQQLIE